MKSGDGVASWKPKEARLSACISIIFIEKICIFQGQFQQALLVDLFYNQSKTNGFFFEAGAYDGVIASNTLLFETRRNWTGLLVEANPDNYDALLQKG